MSNEIKIICGSVELFKLKAEKRPPGYLEELEPCIVSRDANKICMNVMHPAYTAAALKYDANKIHDRTVLVDISNRDLMRLAKTNDNLLTLFDGMRLIKQAPENCLSCGGDQTGEWEKLFNQLKLEIASSSGDKLDALKKALNATKLRVIYKQDKVRHTALL